MKNQLLASSLLILTAMDVSAGWWRTEQNKTLYADFGTYTFTNPDDNQVGKTFNQTLVININGQPYTDVYKRQRLKKVMVQSKVTLCRIQVYRFYSEKGVLAIVF